MITSNNHRSKVRTFKEYTALRIGQSKVLPAIASAVFTMALLSPQAGMFGYGPIGSALARPVLVTDRTKSSVYDGSIQHFQLAGDHPVDGHPHLVGPGPRVALPDDPDRDSPKREAGSHFLAGGRAPASPLAALPAPDSSDRPPAGTAPLVGGFCPWVPQPGC
jgi:hypothetical protein